jgi:hypothetical protein
MREACEWLERRLAWLAEEWETRGPKGHPNPDASELMTNIMAELRAMIDERFDLGVHNERGRTEVVLYGVTAVSWYSLRLALRNWVSVARLRLSVAAEEAPAETVARAA